MFGWIDFEEIAKSGINIEELGGFLDDLVRVESRSGEDERNAGAVIPKSIFSSDLFFANVPTMVGPENDDGILIEAGFLDLLHDASDLMINEGGAGEIGAGKVLPLLGFLQKFQARLGELPMKIPGEARGIIAVGGMNGGELEGIERMLVEPLLGGEAGNVGEEKASGAEEGLTVFFGRLLVEKVNGPGGDLVVDLVFILVREDAPVGELVGRGCILHQTLFGERSTGGSGPRFVPLDVLTFGLFSVAAVENLPRHAGVVAVVGEVLGKRSVILVFGQAAEKGRESIDAGRVGT